MQTKARDALDAAQVRRIGVLAGRLDVPADFDDMGADEIAGLFEPGA